MQSGNSCFGQRRAAFPSLVLPSRFHPFAPNHRVELLIVSSFALRDWPTKERVMEGDGGIGEGGRFAFVIKCTRGNDCHPATGRARELTLPALTYLYVFG